MVVAAPKPCVPQPFPSLKRFYFKIVIVARTVWASTSPRLNRHLSAYCAIRFRRWNRSAAILFKRSYGAARLPNLRALIALMQEVMAKARFIARQIAAGAVR
jgi:hypothetical protein